jgi:hypothetical protein
MAIGGVVVETFTIGLGNRWWVRAFGRNPLVRRSDRIEALVLVLAVVLTVVAIPIAGAIGTSLHEERTQAYAEEAQTMHQVIATATEEGQVIAIPRGVAFRAEATWSYAGRAHRAVVPWPGWAKVGDQQSVWVDEVGENVAERPSSSQADAEAVGVAVAVWLGVAEASAALVYLVRRRLNRSRYAQWDREINAFRDNDGRRNHQS